MTREWLLNALLDAVVVCVVVLTAFGLLSCVAVGMLLWSM